MSLNYYKLENRDVCSAQGWGAISVSSLWLCLLEEVGELAASVRRHMKIYADHKKMDIKSEIMDVFSYVLQLADMYNIDLDKTWNKHMINDSNMSIQKVSDLK